MLWSLALYVLAGVFGSSIFTWTGAGILRCTILAAVVQGLDMFRVYHVTVKRIRQQPPHIQQEQMATFKQRLHITFPQFYVAKVIGYGLVTLVVASVARAIMS